MSDFIFVYGTLQRETKNEMSLFLKDNSFFFTKGYFLGKLFDVEHFPAAVKSKNSIEKVYGSLYQIADSKTLFAVLDVYEDVPNLFKRQVVSVFTTNHKKMESWIYLFNQSTKGLRSISSGDYLKYLKED